MFQVTKVLLLMWLLFCGLIGGCSVFMGGVAATAETPSIEEVMSDNPEFTEQQAEEYLVALEAGGAVGGTVVAGMGVFGAFILWVVGMIPLLIMYLVFRPSGTTIQVQQVVGSTPASQTSRHDRG